MDYKFIGKPKPSPSEIWIEMSKSEPPECKTFEVAMHLEGDLEDESGEYTQPHKTIYFPDPNGDVEVGSEDKIEYVSVFVPYRLMKAFVDLVEARKSKG